MNPSQLADVTEMSNGNVRRLLFSMIRDDEVRKAGRAKYTLPDINPPNIGNKVTSGRDR
jgi:hypothetical protein